jgi:hypothetical protein
MRTKYNWVSLLISLLPISLLAAEKNLIDISAVVSKTEAEKILGEPVRNPTPLNVNGKDGYYSKCNYYSTKSARSLLLRVRQASEGSVDPQAEFNQVTGNGAKFQTIDGLGERAAMLNGVPENGLPPNALMLYVVKGKSFVTIGLSGMADEETALTRAKQVAEKVLAQL